MRKALKLAGILAAVLILVTIVGAAALRLLLPPEKVRELAMRGAEESLGRKLELSGISIGLWRGVRLGWVWLGLGLMNPLTVVVAWALVAAHLAVLAGLAGWRRAAGWGSWLRFARRAAWGGVVSSPLVLYTALRFSADPFLRAWTAQNLILSPHPLHYVVAYGWVAGFVALGAWKIVGAFPHKGWLPVVWVLAFPVLAYAPYNLQRRLPEGVWAAMALLTVYAFDVGAARRWTRWLLTLAFPSTLFLLAGGLLAASNLAPPVFQPVDVVRAFAFIGQTAQPGDVVLTSFESGNALPAWAPVRVVIGHGPESVGLAELRPQVTAVFTAATPESDRQALLDAWDVRFVLWGPNERALGGWNPAEAGYLAEVYRGGEVRVFAVQPARPSP